jgi:coatomer protein complex subunit epsilon
VGWYARGTSRVLQIPGLRTVSNSKQGGEKYQSAFYVFEELAQTAQTQSPHSLLAQAVSELHLNRLGEAEAALQQAVELDDTNADTLANMIVLNTLLGKREEVKGLKKKLAGVDMDHRMLKDWEEKRGEFERARTKYTPKFEVTA